MKAPDPEPPQNLDAELAVLGAVLIEPSCLPRVEPIITRHDFHRQAYGHVFEAVRRMWKRRAAVDVISVRSELDAYGILEQCGGVAVIVGAMETCVSVSNVEWYAEKVRDASIRRSIIDASRAAIDAAYDKTTPLLETVAAMQLNAKTAIDRAVGAGAAQEIRTTAREMYDDAEERSEAGHVHAGIRSGFSRLDYLIGGAEPGQLIVIGARPGGGKSALLFQLATYAAQHSNRALIISLEMSEREVTRRIISQMSGVDGRRIKAADLTTEEWAHVGAATARTEDMHLRIIDGANMPVEEVGARIRQYDGCTACYVDYLQLIRGPAGEKRFEQIGHICRELKQLAKSCGVPIFAAAQVGRETDKRSNQEPILSDLRESGDIEANADVVIFTWRDSDLDVTAPVWDIHCKVAKARDAATGYVPLQFRPACVRFEPRASGFGA